ncbi:MAG: glycosyltransferase family 4 protein, partial [Acidobacteriota bacterium]
FEAFGTAAIEAMAAGLPVIASDVGGLRDFVESGVNGFRVPSQQAQPLAEALTRVLTDDRLRATLAAGAAQTAPRFDVEVVLGEFERVIDGAISRRRAELS